MDMKDKGWLLFTGFFALMGTGLLAGAYLSWHSTQRVIRSGVETTGVVIDVRYGRDKQGRTTTSQAPVIQFRTVAGEPVTYYSSTYTTPAGFSRGEVVKLWYLPENPQEDVILEGADTWLVTAVLGGMGMLFALIGYPALIREWLVSAHR
jgi:hypothetical protein